ncbi:hypothetical protein HDU93_006227, partial [Gonapodya sp. JEL0774]
ILAQKTEIARQSQAVTQHVSAETVRQREEAERQREREIERFQKAQGSMGVGGNGPAASDLEGKSEARGNGEKRGELPSFWVPSLTPNATPTAPEVSKTEVVCCADDPPHPISAKKLFPVEFATSKDAKGDLVIACPSCTKSLINGVKLS